MMRENLSKAEKRFLYFIYVFRCVDRKLLRLYDGDYENNGRDGDKSHILTAVNHIGNNVGDYHLCMLGIAYLVFIHSLAKL